MLSGKGVPYHLKTLLLIDNNDKIHMSSNPFILTAQGAPFRDSICFLKIMKSKKEGFYTYEAAVLLPIFAFFVLVFMLVFRCLSFQWGLFSSVYESSAHIALCGDETVDEENGVQVISPMSVYVMARETVKKNNVSTQFLSHDLMFMDFAGTDVNDRNIDVKIGNLMPLLAGQKFFGKRGYEIGTRVCIRRWNGYDPAAGASDDTVVYVAENGEVYHTDLSCTYIRLSIHTGRPSQLSFIRNKSGHIYHPCEVCGDAISGVCYYTDYGERAHSSLTCSKLKRTIQTIPLKEAVKNYRPCSKCGTGEHDGDGNTAGISGNTQY